MALRSVGWKTSLLSGGKEVAELRLLLKPQFSEKFHQSIKESQGPNGFLKILPANSVALGLGFQHMNSQWHIRTIARYKQLLPKACIIISLCRVIPLKCSLCVLCCNFQSLDFNSARIPLMKTENITPNSWPFFKSFLPFPGLWEVSSFRATVDREQGASHISILIFTSTQPNFQYFNIS